MLEELCFANILFTQFNTVHVIVGYEERGIKTYLIGTELPDGTIKFLNN